ncbi:cytochrome P450 family protein [Streptomyces xanthophaeus]|uniref:Cytochrome P450 n=1 Tax=Streptomyces xanthophaeus TaxID=67385 RepID=A0A919LG93_9ACTN|nr:cytochrome P450 [Streptomyces xanthophaeus]GHI86852.1 cytochrome P450 [Streptomyces xanthophaeus]
MTGPASRPAEIDTAAFFADQHGHYGRLRDTPGPRLVRNPQGLAYWLVTRHDEAKAALRDPRLSKDPQRAADALGAAGYGVSGAESFFLPLVNSDPPDHTRLRRLVSGAFTPRRVAALRPAVDKLTHELLDAMAESEGRRAAAGAPVDLMASLAFPLPVLVISELVGVPHGNRGALLKWATQMLTVSGRGATPAAGPAERTRRLHRWFASLVAARRPLVRTGLPADEQPDLLSALVAAQAQEQQLSDDELVSLLVLLLLAGHETTTGLIGNAVDALLRHPGQLAVLRRNPELVPSAVDELLRYETSLARTTLRVAAEDVELAGVVIPAGSIVSVALAAANRDPEVFSAPDRLDVTRTPVPHLSFGHGIHFCIGAPLARLQTETVLTALLDRYPDLVLADPEQPQAWRPIGDMRGLLTLPVRLAPSA